MAKTVEGRFGGNRPSQAHQEHQPQGEDCSGRRFRRSDPGGLGADRPEPDRSAAWAMTTLCVSFVSSPRREVDDVQKKLRPNLAGLGNPLTQIKLGPILYVVLEATGGCAPTRRQDRAEASASGYLPTNTAAPWSDHGRCVNFVSYYYHYRPQCRLSIGQTAAGTR